MKSVAVFTAAILLHSACFQPAQARETEGEAYLQILEEMIKKQGISGALAESMRESLKNNPGKDRLAGKSGDRFYAIVFRKSPSQNPRMVSSSKSLAVRFSTNECLRFFVLEQVFKSKGLSNGTWALEALNKGFEQSTVNGRIRPDFSASADKGPLVSGLTVASRMNMDAQLTTSGAKSDFLKIYRTLAHKNAYELLDRGDWSKSLAIFDELESGEAANFSTWMGKAKCLAELERPTEAVKYLKSALDQSGEVTSEWLMVVGEMASGLGKEGQSVAELAFVEACKRFEKENNNFDPGKVP